MTGILRLGITDKVTGRGAWRFHEARALWPQANRIYRQVFYDLRTELEPGESIQAISSQEHAAGYDKEFGVDVWLAHRGGLKSTLQEKFLFTDFNTVTVEFMQDWREMVEGDWFNLRVEYYFVAYSNKGSGEFRDWILLDWPATKRLTEQGRIGWSERRNQKDGARASFRWAGFDDFPPQVVIARMSKPELQAPEANSVEWHRQKIYAIHAEVRALPPSVLYAPMEFQQRVNRHMEEIERLLNIRSL